jgi:hypothetical protein
MNADYAKLTRARLKNAEVGRGISRQEEIT